MRISERGGAGGRKAASGAFLGRGRPSVCNLGPARADRTGSRRRHGDTGNARKHGTRRSVPGDRGRDQSRVWPFGAGTKKLIVAFHFLRSNPAAWKCDECRKSRLETTRG